MAVEDADPAVDGAGGAAVAVGVEGDGLDEVAVAVLEVEVEGGRGVLGRGVDLGWEEARHRESMVWVARWVGYREKLEVGFTNKVSRK